MILLDNLLSWEAQWLISISNFLFKETIPIGFWWLANFWFWIPFWIGISVYSVLNYFEYALWRAVLIIITGYVFTTLGTLGLSEILRQPAPCGTSIVNELLSKPYLCPGVSSFPDWMMATFFYVIRVCVPIEKVFKINYAMGIQISVACLCCVCRFITAQAFLSDLFAGAILGLLLGYLFRHILQSSFLTHAQ